MSRRLMLRLFRLACETERKLRAAARATAGHSLPTADPAVSFTRARKTGVHRLSLLALCAVLILSVTPGVASAQSESSPAAAGEPRASGAQATPETPAGGEQESGEHGEGVLPVIARIVNFVILVGTLVYFLRSPLATYLNNRGTQIRRDLVDAAEMKRTAAAQLEEIERRMKALPGELEALRAQGAREIAAEEGRIRAAAAAERDRLLEQARRDIDQHVKIAERELVSHAADLAVGVAAERIKKTITDDDQKRLADRYVQQLKSGAGAQT